MCVLLPLLHSHQPVNGRAAANIHVRLSLAVLDRQWLEWLRLALLVTSITVAVLN